MTATATAQKPFTAADVTRALRKLWPSPIRISTRIDAGHIVITGPHSLDDYGQGVLRLLFELSGGTRRYTRVATEVLRGNSRRVTYAEVQDGRPIVWEKIGTGGRFRPRRPGRRSAPAPPT